MTDVDELIQRALKSDPENITPRFAYAHTTDKWWHLRKRQFKVPPREMVLLFVCGVKKSTKDLTIQGDYPSIGDICYAENEKIEILSVEWA